MYIIFENKVNFLKLELLCKKIRNFVQKEKKNVFFVFFNDKNLEIKIFTNLGIRCEKSSKNNISRNS